MEQFISRITRLTLTAAAIACLSLAATACDSSTGTPAPGHTSTRAGANPSPRPTVKPALDRQAALALIRHYSTVNNQANARDNARLLDTVENGPLFAMSVGRYKQDSGTPARDRPPYERRSYDVPTARLYIPKLATGTARWFAAGLTQTGTTQQSLVVFTQQSDRSWQMVLDCDLDGAPLPPVAVDADGYATAVSTDGSHLAPDAGRLRTAVTDNFVTGGKFASSQVLTPTAASLRQIAVYTKDIRHLGTKGTTAFASADIPWKDAYGLTTEGGGALVLFAHAHTQTDTVFQGWQIVSGPSTRAWLGTSPRQSITATFVCADAALVPSPHTKAQLLGSTCQLTTADGPPAGSRTSS